MKCFLHKCRAAGALVALLLAVTSSNAQLMWRAKKNEDTIILLPSIHIALRGGYRLSAEGKSILNSAKKVFFETDLSDSSDSRSMLLGKETDSDGWLSLSGPAQLYIDECYRRKGIPQKLYRQLRVWAMTIDCNAAFLAAQGFSIDYGSEQVVKNYLVSRGTMVGQLETLNEQYAALSRIPVDVYKSMLPSYEGDLNFVTEEAANVELALQHIQSKNIDGLEALYRSTFWGSPQSRIWEREVILRRNENFMEKIRQGLGPFPILFVVGVYHLVGPAGLLVQLQNMGYSIEEL